VTTRALTVRLEVRLELRFGYFFDLTHKFNASAGSATNGFYASDSAQVWL